MCLVHGQGFAAGGVAFLERDMELHADGSALPVPMPWQDAWQVMRRAVLSISNFQVAINMSTFSSFGLLLLACPPLLRCEGVADLHEGVVVRGEALHVALGCGQLALQLGHLLREPCMKPARS